jgi:hypothetical protein
MINDKLPSESASASKARIKSEEEIKKRVIEAGLLGRLFGTNRNVSLYISAFIAIIMLIAGICYSFLIPNNSNLTVKDFWTIISPFITTALGFIIGKKWESE